MVRLLVLPVRPGRVLRLFSLALLCTALGCSSAPATAVAAQMPPPVEVIPSPATAPALPATADVMAAVFLPHDPRPGYPVTVAATRGFGIETASLMSGGRRLSGGTFFPVTCDEGRDFLATVLTVPTTAAAGSAEIVLAAAGEPVMWLPLEIAPREFRSETIRMNNAMAGIQADQSAERTAQAQHLWAVLGRVGDETHFFGGFVRPVVSTRRTSIFGSRRVFVNANGTSSTSIHAGIDYGVPTGTPVFASGAGRVVLARDRIVSGRSVIIEHLPGVFSIYYHLDSIGVSEGDMIAAGAVLGLSGSTGFSTGPHLHWEVRVFGENTDPDALVARPLLDKNALSAKLEDGAVANAP